MSREHYSVSEVAAALGVSRQRVHQLCKAGRITGAKQAWPGGPWLIPAKVQVVRGRRPKAE